MKRFNRLLTTLALLSGSLFAITPLVMADENKALDISITKVDKGIYMLAGINGFVGGNIGLVVGDDGVILIDDGLSQHLDLIEKTIKKVTQKPIDFLINTHVHQDHIGNNEAIGKQGAHIVAHENIRLRLLEAKQATAKDALPVITFSESINFHLNGYDTHVFHTANAHTDGDAVILFENANVIHTGDTFFNGMFPFIDLNNHGSLKGYINAQKKILSLSNNKTKIIPGHGSLANNKDLSASIEMLETSKRLIEDLIALNKSEEQVVKINPLSNYHQKWNWAFITTEKMTRQIYKSLKNQ